MSDSSDEYVNTYIKQLCNDAWLSEMCGQCINKISDFKEQGLANTMWAMGKLGYRNDGVLAVMCKASMAKLNGFNPQALSNNVWALGTLRCTGKAVLAAMCEEGVAKF